MSSPEPSLEHENTLFSCDECIYKCTDESFLARHKEIVHATHATLTTSNVKSPIAEPKTSDDENSETCNSDYDASALLKVEINEDVNGDAVNIGVEKPKFICDYCGKVLSSKVIIKHHIKIKHTNQNGTKRKKRKIKVKYHNYLCMFCFDPFKDTTELLKHIKMHLKANEQPCLFRNLTKPMQESIEKNYNFKEVQNLISCQYCEYKCKTKRHLNFHLRLHTGEKAFECNICKEKFSKQEFLKNHMLVHYPSDEKLFKCSQCEYSCKDSMGLKRHVGSHVGYRAYACKLCSYRARLSSHLNRHMKTHANKAQNNLGKT